MAIIEGCKQPPCKLLDVGRVKLTIPTDNPGLRQACPVGHQLQGAASAVKRNGPQFFNRAGIGLAHEQGENCETV